MLLEINPKNPEPRKIKRAVDALESGGVIAYPTDTVYGLGCDLFNKKREMVHVKRYGGSGVLSHLFAQGATSAELLLFDTDFRTKVRGKLPAAYKSLVPAGGFQPKGFEVVYGIIGRPGGSKPLSQLLPFFSRVTLRRAAQRLKGAGYGVSVAWIPNS